MKIYLTILFLSLLIGCKEDIKLENVDADNIYTYLKGSNKSVNKSTSVLNILNLIQNSFTCPTVRLHHEM